MNSGDIKHFWAPLALLHWKALTSPSIKTPSHAAVGWGSRHIWLVKLATKPSKAWRWRQERAGTRQLRLRDEDSVTPKWEHNKNHIICHGKYALPDASLYCVLYFEFSTACFKYRILFNHQDKQRHYFLHFQHRKIWFQEFTFSFSSSKKLGGGLWRNRERKHRCVWPKGCAL